MKKIIIPLFLFVFFIVVSASLPCQNGAVSDLLPSSSLTLRYEGEELLFTYDDLTSLEAYAGNGGRLKVTGEVTGPFSYTGVRLLTFINQFDAPPASYKAVVVSEDGLVQTFTAAETAGDVMVYTTQGEENGVGGVTMMLAYKEEGATDFSGGPFRIAWVNTGQPVTDAFLWSKYVCSIDFFDDSSDTILPSLSLEKPVNGFYIFNRRIFPFITPVIFGGITVEVKASDASGIAQVLFVVDEELKAQDANAPYQWEWDEHVVGYHTLTVVTYDAAGNIQTQQQDLWIFNP